MRLRIVSPERGASKSESDGLRAASRGGPEASRDAELQGALDDALAHKSRRGDPVALGQLYRRHAAPLVSYLQRFTGNADEAQDLLHETFVRIYEGKGQYRGRGRFRAWLFTIATRLALDHAKQRRRRAELLEQHLRPQASHTDPLQDSVYRDTLRRIDSVLADLPREYAQAFHLRLREQFTYREMATISGDPEGTLRSRVHHTLKRIQVALRAEQGSDDVE